MKAHGRSLMKSRQATKDVEVKSLVKFEKLFARVKFAKTEW